MTSRAWNPCGNVGALLCSISEQDNIVNALVCTIGTWPCLLWCTSKWTLKIRAIRCSFFGNRKRGLTVEIYNSDSGQWIRALPPAASIFGVVPKCTPFDGFPTAPITTPGAYDFRLSNHRDSSSIEEFGCVPAKSYICPASFWGWNGGEIFLHASQSMWWLSDGNSYQRETSNIFWLSDLSTGEWNPLSEKVTRSDHHITKSVMCWVVWNVILQWILSTFQCRS